MKYSNQQKTLYYRLCTHQMLCLVKSKTTKIPNCEENSQRKFRNQMAKSKVQRHHKNE